MAEFDDVMRILMANANKSFVKRILNPDPKLRLDLGNGQYATHKMAWADMDTPQGKKYIVYPTVLYNGKNLADYGDQAYDMVMKTGNYIEFDDPKQADWFSRRYKAAWGE